MVKSCFDESAAYPVPTITFLMDTDLMEMSSQLYSPACTYTHKCNAHIFCRKFRNYRILAYAYKVNCCTKHLKIFQSSHCQT